MTANKMMCSFCVAGTARPARFVFKHGALVLAFDTQLQGVRIEAAIALVACGSHKAEMDKAFGRVWPDKTESPMEELSKLGDRAHVEVSSEIATAARELLEYKLGTREVSKKTRVAHRALLIKPEQPVQPKAVEKPKAQPDAKTDKVAAGKKGPKQQRKPYKAPPPPPRVTFADLVELTLASRAPAAEKPGPTKAAAKAKARQGEVLKDLRDGKPVVNADAGTSEAPKQVDPRAYDPRHGACKTDWQWRKARPAGGARGKPEATKRGVAVAGTGKPKKK